MGSRLLKSSSPNEWKITLITENTSGEGIGTGDIDNDGLIDIACGRRAKGEKEPTLVVWYKNPGKVSETWKSFEVSKTSFSIDRVEVADINGDNKAEIIISEERWPGKKPEASLYWFERGTEPSQPWKKHKIVTQYSMNNLDVADIDMDGDIDIVTNEHKGKALHTQLWVNDGSGIFSLFEVDKGKENHLGTQFIDIDKDGDLDIVGAAWDVYTLMHIWENQAL